MISIISMCFAGALCYNLHEFRNVGTRSDAVTDKMTKEHDRPIAALDQINESLVNLTRSIKGKK